MSCKKATANEPDGEEVEWEGHGPLSLPQIPRVVLEVLRGGGNASETWVASQPVGSSQPSQRSPAKLRRTGLGLGHCEGIQVSCRVWGSNITCITRYCLLGQPGLSNQGVLDLYGAGFADHWFVNRCGTTTRDSYVSLPKLDP